MEMLNRVHLYDARYLDSVVEEEIVDVTITSPPYFDLKDYGYEDQIGFGQSYQDFLEDLYSVFQKVFNVTKSTGTLWVIIDIFRKDGEITLLPFDFAKKIKPIGWRLQEIIIWHKDRTVPWAHKGQMRNSFEYVLVFSKSDNFQFEIDRIREVTSLKKWWVKYPERYNPKGKAPEAVWNYDIPTQGSWGNGYIDHFCPLPEALIERILHLTTRENDLVLDPFAGSGAVLSVADKMKRQYLGFELNPKYVEMFQKYLLETRFQKRMDYETAHDDNQQKFEKIILDLRALKYARVLLRKIEKQLGPVVRLIYVEKWVYSSAKKHSLIKVNYRLLTLTPNADQEVNDLVLKVAAERPLSKFGIDAEFDYFSDVDDFYALTDNPTVFTYTIKNTHEFQRSVELSHCTPQFRDHEVVISRIKVAINEKDVEENGAP